MFFPKARIGPSVRKAGSTSESHARLKVGETAVNDRTPHVGGCLCNDPSLKAILKYYGSHARDRVTLGRLLEMVFDTRQ